MLDLFAQQTRSIWQADAGSGRFTMQVVVALILSALIFVGVMNVPTRGRRTLVASLTFLAGLLYVAWYLWPKPIGRGPGQLPAGLVESVGFYLADTQLVVSDFANILTAFLLGLGVISMLNIHTRRVVRNHPDKFYSMTLLVSLAVMAVFGYVDWYQRDFGPNKALLDNEANWGFFNRGWDLMFDGVYQQMEAAMFSIIAFYILSAAYRAFRIRSIESTILLSAALIMMLSLMGGIEYLSNQVAIGLGGGPGNPDAWINNLRLTEISGWINANLQVPSLRAMDFGIGIGALAMGLRLWLSLEKGGVSAS